LYLKSKGGMKYIITAVPCLIMLVITSWAMVRNEIDFYKQENWLLVIIGAGISILAVWMIIEAVMVFCSKKSTNYQQKESLSI